jgi:hypothetical protein
VSSAVTHCARLLSAASSPGNPVTRLAADSEQIKFGASVQGLVEGRRRLGYVMVPVSKLTA